MRYTMRNLRDDVASINKGMEDRGIPYRYSAQQRNNRTAIDLMRIKSDDNWSCEVNVAIGTPRECLDACRTHSLYTRLEDADKKIDALKTELDTAVGALRIATNALAPHDESAPLREY